ncbi:MAG: MFS transporter [Actinomycetota bacterium]
MRRIVAAVAPVRWGRSFRPLLGSSWASNLADGILWVAAPFLVESLTDDALVVGISWLLGRLPWLLFGLHAGAIADRFDRRRIVLVANAIQLGLITTLAVGVATDSVGVGAVLVFGIHAAMWGTTSTTVRQVATPEALQGRVGAVYMVAVQGGLVIGAAVGAVLAGRIDITAPYWFGFVGSAVMLALIWRTLGHLTPASASPDRPDGICVRPLPDPGTR